MVEKGKDSTESGEVLYNAGLEGRRIAQKLNRLPTRENVIQYANYPIEYYDNYFVSWGEVCASARHHGMSEEKDPTPQPEEDFGQLKIF